MILTELNLQYEINRWFSKSLIDFKFSIDDTTAEAVLEIFKTDYARYFPDDINLHLINVHLRAELQGILLYRIARIFYQKGEIRIADALSALGRFLSGFEIYYSSLIGKGLKINHGLGTIIGARSIIGDDVLIHQGVTFGDKDGGRPKVGDAVTVYAGAIILGKISIGDNSIIGANAVLFKDLPSNCIAVGNPARIIIK